MQVALSLLLVVSLLAILVGTGFGLFARGKRTKGWLVVAASLVVAMGSGVGLGVVADLDARSAGYLDYMDQVRASVAGIDDPAEWSKVRDQHLARDLAVAAEKAESSRQPTKEELCRADLACWGDKQAVWAGFHCTPEIEKLATYRANWTDSWMELKVSHYRWLDEDAGTLTMIGDQVEFENGFGAAVNMVYECDIDPKAEAVLAVRVYEGRL